MTGYLGQGMTPRHAFWCLGCFGVGLLVGGAGCFLHDPLAPLLLMGAGLLSGAAALVLGLRSGHERSSGDVPSGGASNSDLSPRAREIFERLPDPLMLLDDSGRIILANPAMTAAAGTAEMEQSHVSSVWRTPTLLEAIDSTATSGESAFVAFSVRVPVEHHYQAYVIRTDHSPCVTAVLLHDVTAMLRSQQARADFVANASHELRTPLAALSGFVDTLKGHARDDEQARGKFLDIMTAEADRMRRLIDDLLSLTRIEQNEHVPPHDEVELEGVIHQAAAALHGLARMDEVTLVVESLDALPPVIGDRDELIQLFQNLIHNAIKYGRRGGHVWLTGVPDVDPGTPAWRRRADAFLAVAIRDDGEGIPREAIPRLTERFYRVNVRRSRERGGTGLGLAIVKHIVNRHQGKLLIDSKEGVGSTFTVVLPAARHAAETPPPCVIKLM